jgi:kynurenine formamidase
MVRALWSPSGRDIITVAEFNVRMSSWDLGTQSCTHLPGPKHADKGIHYSKCGQHLAVIEVS